MYTVIGQRLPVNLTVYPFLLFTIRRMVAVASDQLEECSYICIRPVASDVDLNIRCHP